MVGSLVRPLMPVSTFAEILGLPATPLLVVMINTPLAPFAPYTAVADASFSKEMLAISSGSILLKAPP